MPTSSRPVLPRFLQRVIRRGNRRRTTYVVSLLEGCIRHGESLLDVGAGACLVSERLMDMGYAVTALDIRNLSCSERVTPVLYDGGQFPSPDGAFHVAVIAYVLHHVRDPIGLLRETLAWPRGSS